MTISMPILRPGRARLAALALLAFALTLSAGTFAQAQEDLEPGAPPVVEEAQPAAPPVVDEPGPAPVETEQTPPETAAPDTAAQENEPVIFDDVADALPAHDLSVWGMFMMADWVVKGVMIGLAAASLATWTVWIAKAAELAGARARARRALDIIVGSRSLAEAGEALGRRGGPAALLVRAAEHEMKMSADVVGRADGSGIKERVASHLSRIEAQAGRRMTRGTGILATIGSTAPFVGLFGTVWGIMNSFIGIAEAQTTNLAVVAPGIAEALLATALGLVAAIPAVVIYNAFARSISGYRLLMGDASAAVERLVSRDIDHRAVAGRVAG